MRWLARLFPYTARLEERCARFEAQTVELAVRLEAERAEHRIERQRLQDRFLESKGVAPIFQEPQAPSPPIKVLSPRERLVEAGIERSRRMRDEIGQEVQEFLRNGGAS